MFKWTFLEGENIVESRTGLHLSLPGLDAEIMAIKDWWSTYSIESASAVCEGPVNHGRQVLNLYSLWIIIFLIKRKMWYPWV